MEHKQGARCTAEHFRTLSLLLLPPDPRVAATACLHACTCSKTVESPEPKRASSISELSSPQVWMGLVHKVKRAAAAFESQMAASSPLPVASSPSVSVSKYPRFGKRGAPQAFPSKLYEILEGENPDIVGWTSTGRGFEVSV